MLNGFVHGKTMIVTGHRFGPMSAMDQFRIKSIAICDDLDEEPDYQRPQSQIFSKKKRPSLTPKNTPEKTSTTESAFQINVPNQRSAPRPEQTKFFPFNIQATGLPHLANSRKRSSPFADQFPPAGKQ